jgi:hypothetical protein
VLPGGGDGGRRTEDGGEGRIDVVFASLEEGE